MRSWALDLNASGTEIRRHTSAEEVALEGDQAMTSRTANQNIERVQRSVAGRGNAVAALFRVHGRHHAILQPDDGLFPLLPVHHRLEEMATILGGG